MVDYLLAQGAIVRHDGQWVVLEGVEASEVGVPQSLRQMIEKQIDRLSVEEQRLLEAASIAGVEFSAAAVAAALAADVEQIEEWCEGLARRQLFLRPTGNSEWPDGTLTDALSVPARLISKRAVRASDEDAAAAPPSADWRAAGGRIRRAGARDCRGAGGAL